jgi:hypothetical protein
MNANRILEKTSPFIFFSLDFQFCVVLTINIRAPVAVYDLRGPVIVAKRKYDKKW